VLESALCRQAPGQEDRRYGTECLPARDHAVPRPGLSGVRTYRGAEPPAAKKPRKGELTAAEKRTHRAISRLRVRVDHALAGVKCSRSVKEVSRNTKADVADLVMAIACGLHNLRVQYRKRRLKLSPETLFQIKSIVPGSVNRPSFRLESRTIEQAVHCRWRYGKKH
jgi:hypothetical protein